MLDFITRRQLIRSVDRNSEPLSQVEIPQDGWIATIRRALTLPADVIAMRKGVTRAAIYQAERSEKDGGISLKQMEKIAAAMGGRFVYGIAFDEPLEAIRYKRAIAKAKQLSQYERDLLSLSLDDRQDWIEDKAAELLHDMPSDFWIDDDG